MNIETANRLFQYRKKHNLSQEELANQIGVSRQAVSKWERAEASPDTDNLILLAKIYGVTLDQLLQGVEETEEKPEEKPEEKAEQENAEQVEQCQCWDEGCDSDKKYKKVDHVSFKNGIHVHSKDGDDVDISFRDGIKVHDKDGTHVNIGKDGVFVEDKGEQKVYTDKDGSVYCSEDVADEHNKAKKIKKNVWMMFPFYLIAIIGFLGWGFSGWLGGFSISWIVFLTIPLYYTTVEAILKRKANIFCYPVLVVIVFLLGGLLCGLWHPLWVIFLTVPIYYFICDLVNRNKDED